MRVRRARWMLGIVAVGLLVSGATVWLAMPGLKAAQEIVWGEGQTEGGISGFVMEAIEGLEATDRDYPFLFYAHDWLAFAHIVLAILFAGAARDPVRNEWVVQCGLIMCVLVPVLAGVGIPLRGLPWQWFFIDTAFGVVAGALLGVAYRDIRRVKKETVSLA